jgi:hypothetical protein
VSRTYSPDGEQGTATITVEQDGESRPVRFHSRHSPTGYAWGYGGSGPAQLALDILWDYLGEEPPPWLYQQFKTDVIAKLEPDKLWTITAAQIEEWLDVRAETY